jgi:hypothetical protein
MDRSPTQRPTPSQTILEWIQDSYAVIGRAGRNRTFNLTLTSNRQVLQGSYRLRVTIVVDKNRTTSATRRYEYNTTCLPYHANASLIQAELAGILAKFQKVGRGGIVIRRL